MPRDWRETEVTVSTMARIAPPWIVCCQPRLLTPKPTSWLLRCSLPIFMLVWMVPGMALLTTIWTSAFCFLTGTRPTQDSTRLLMLTFFSTVPS